MPRTGGTLAIRSTEYSAGSVRTGYPEAIRDSLAIVRNCAILARHAACREWLVWWRRPFRTKTKVEVRGNCEAVPHLSRGNCEAAVPHLPTSPTSPSPHLRPISPLAQYSETMSSQRQPTGTKRVAISYRIEPSGEECRLLIEFAPDELSRLDLFLRNVSELRASGVLQHDLACSLNMSGDSDGTGQWQVTVPSRASVSLLLHHLRPLILQKEDGTFLKAAKVVKQRVQDDRFRLLLKELRREYDGRNSRSRWRIVSNGVLLNSDDTLFDWLNGFEYHRDEIKRKRIEETFGPLSKEAVFAILISLVLDKLHAILNMEKIVFALIKQPRTLTFELPTKISNE